MLLTSVIWESGLLRRLRFSGAEKVGWMKWLEIAQKLGRLDWASLFPSRLSFDPLGPLLLLVGRTGILEFLKFLLLGALVEFEGPLVFRHRDLDGVPRLLIEPGTAAEVGGGLRAKTGLGQ